MALKEENSHRKNEEFEIKPKKVEIERNSTRTFSETFEDLKENINIDSFMRYAKKNTQETIAYALLLLGVIWFLFQMFYGGIIVGLVAGYFFSKEIITLIKTSKEFINEQGTVRTVTLAASTLILFISAPGFFIGVAIMTGIKMLMGTKRK